MNASSQTTTVSIRYVWKCATTQTVLWSRKLNGMIESITAPVPPIAQPASPM